MPARATTVVSAPTAQLSVTAPTRGARRLLGGRSLRRLAAPAVVVELALVAWLAAPTLREGGSLPSVVTTTTVPANPMTPPDPIGSTAPADASAAPATMTPTAAPTAPPAATPHPMPSPRATPRPTPTANPTPRPTPAPATPTPSARTAPGELQVVVRPWGEVTLDGGTIGQTPFPPLELEPGEHTLTVSHLAYEVIERRFQVQSRGSQRIVIDFVAEGVRKR